jgi:hypothetical protein
MRSEALIAYVPKSVAERLKKRASSRKLSVSGYLLRIIEDDDADLEEQDDLRFPKSELERRLKEVEDLSKCKIYETLDDLLADLHSNCEDD